jgi:hypothetical protein
MRVIYNSLVSFILVGYSTSWALDSNPITIEGCRVIAESKNPPDQLHSEILKAVNDNQSVLDSGISMLNFVQEYSKKKKLKAVEHNQIIKNVDRLADFCGSFQNFELFPQWVNRDTAKTNEKVNLKFAKQCKKLSGWSEKIHNKHLSDIEKVELSNLFDNVEKQLIQVVTEARENQKILSQLEPVYKNIAIPHLHMKTLCEKDFPTLFGKSASSTINGSN